MEQWSVNTFRAYFFGSCIGSQQTNFLNDLLLHPRFKTLVAWPSSSASIVSCPHHCWDCIASEEFSDIRPSVYPFDHTWHRSRAVLNCCPVLSVRGATSHARFWTTWKTLLSLPSLPLLPETSGQTFGNTLYKANTKFIYLPGCFPTWHSPYYFALQFSSSASSGSDCDRIRQNCNMSKTKFNFDCCWICEWQKVNQNNSVAYTQCLSLGVFCNF